MVSGTIETPIFGFPYVVTRIDPARYQVTVVEHCRSLRDAREAVDDMTTGHATVQHHIVPAGELVAWLASMRDSMAGEMHTRVMT